MENDFDSDKIIPQQTDVPGYYFSAAVNSPEGAIHTSPGQRPGDGNPTTVFSPERA